jgi:hypothetical protein
MNIARKELSLYEATVFAVSVAVPEPELKLPSAKYTQPLPSFRCQ